MRNFSHLQELAERSGYPGGTGPGPEASEETEGQCILFVDGLRFDAARRLVKMLSARGLRVEEKPAWAPLPR